MLSPIWWEIEARTWDETMWWASVLIRKQERCTRALPCGKYSRLLLSRERKERNPQSQVTSRASIMLLSLVCFVLVRLAVTGEEQSRWQVVQGREQTALAAGSWQLAGGYDFRQPAKRAFLSQRLIHRSRLNVWDEKGRKEGEERRRRKGRIGTAAEAGAAQQFCCLCRPRPTSTTLLNNLRTQRARAGG